MKCNNAKFLALLVTFMTSSLLVLACSSNARAQKSRVGNNTPAVAVEQPLYDEYQGVRLGMTADAVRSKLGKSTISDNEQDYFVVSDTLTLQIAYDSQRKVKAISVDYLNGVGAPDPKAIVGAALETKADGSLYRVVRYESQGFWVSYNRTAGPVIIVTITIQKM